MPHPAPQAIYTLYKPDGSMTLQHFIIIFGAVQLLLSQLPTIHSLRGVNAVCTLCTLGFTFTTVAMSIKNGAPIAPGRLPKTRCEPSGATLSLSRPTHGAARDVRVEAVRLGVTDKRTC